MFTVFTEGPDPGGGIATVAQPELNTQIGNVVTQMDNYVTEQQRQQAQNERDQVKAAAKKIRGRQQSILAGGAAAPAGNGTGMVDAASTPYPFVTG